VDRPGDFDVPEKFVTGFVQLHKEDWSAAQSDWELVVAQVLDTDAIERRPTGARRSGIKPANSSFEQSAAVPLAALSALQALRDKGGIQAAHRVLIIGASGGIGTFAVQPAHWFGAGVTGVCSTRNTELVWSLGAERVVDYTESDFVQSGARYDLIVDVVGNRSIADRRRELIEAGKVTPVVEKVNKFDEIGDAMRHGGQGHAKALIVIAIGQ
jgi:NADPH:quinone reductase-like Zn-dependent oxidoreductase